MVHLVIVKCLLAFRSKMQFESTILLPVRQLPSPNVHRVLFGTEFIPEVGNEQTSDHITQRTELLLPITTDSALFAVHPRVVRRCLAGAEFLHLIRNSWLQGVSPWCHICRHFLILVQSSEMLFTAQYWGEWTYLSRAITVLPRRMKIDSTHDIVRQICNSVPIHWW
jgi:hypothetical protein